ncbi:hypothetical protein Tco_0738076 [Tanacetum coccineum]
MTDNTNTTKENALVALIVYFIVVATAIGAVVVAIGVAVVVAAAAAAAVAVAVAVIAAAATDVVADVDVVVAAAVIAVVVDVAVVGVVVVAVTVVVAAAVVVVILERAHMANCNPIWTPVNTKSKFGDDGDLTQENEEDTLVAILKSLVGECKAVYANKGAQIETSSDGTNELPPKELNPGSFALPCTIGSLNFYAMADLGASVFYDNKCGKDYRMWPTCNPDLSLYSGYDVVSRKGENRMLELLGNRLVAQNSEFNNNGISHEATMYENPYKYHHEYLRSCFLQKDKGMPKP